MKTKLNELMGGSALATIAAGRFGHVIRFAPDEPADPDPGTGDDPAPAPDGEPDKGSRFNSPLRDKKPEGDDDPAPAPDPADAAKPVADGRPEGIPEKFWDPETKALKSDDLVKAYAELEKKHGALRREKGKEDIPATAEEYFADGFDLDPEVDKLHIQGPDDPGLQSWAKIAKKYDIGKERAIAIAKDMFKEMNPLAPDPIDPEAEKAALGKNANNMIDQVFSWLEGNENDFDDGDVEVINGLSSTAKGIRFLAKLRNQSGHAPIPIASNGQVTMSANAWHADFQKAVQSKDYAKQESLQSLADELWPDGVPRAGVPETLSHADRARMKKGA